MVGNRAPSAVVISLPVTNGSAVPFMVNCDLMEGSDTRRIKTEATIGDDLDHSLQLVCMRQAIQSSHSHI